MTSAQPGTIITVAPSGEHPKSEVPQLPVTGVEVAAAAEDCARVGAAVVDIQPRHDVLTEEVVGTLRTRTNLLIRLALYARTESLRDLLEAGAHVVTCPLDAPAEFITEVRERAPEHAATVHYEVRSLDQLALVPPDAKHVVLVFDDGMPGDVSTLAAALRQLPAGATFTATGLAANGVPVMLAAIAAGGHVRVGMADTLLYTGDTPARDNTQLVARVTGVAKIAQRPPLSPEQAAPIFGVIH